VDADDPYVQDTLAYDRLLTRRRFTRICDYQRRITAADLADLEAFLLTAEKERPMHKFLAGRGHLVLNAEPAHGCRWIKSNPHLGTEFSPDFMIARRDSGGLKWTLIELQDPKVQLFIGNGQPGEELREGIHQIGQWRGWIRRWGSNSAEPHGYPGLRDDFRAVILIGRSEDKRQDLIGDDRVRALEQEHRIEIRSYDYITRAAWEVLHECGIDHSSIR
jgi:hypothetical protein